MGGKGPIRAIVQEYFPYRTYEVGYQEFSAASGTRVSWLST